MNDSKKEEDAESKQDPMTAIPIATLLILIELIEELKLKNPEIVDSLSNRLLKIKDTDMGGKYPRSIGLIEAVVKQIKG